MGRKPGSGVMETLDRRRAEFERLYLRQGLALRGVAEVLGVSVKMLTLWMDERGIPRRNRAQAQHNRSRKLGKADQVIRLRLRDHVTMEQIADWMGYASKGTVHNILASRGLDGPLETLPTYEIYLRDKKHGRYAKAHPVQVGQGEEEKAEENPDPGPPEQPS